MTEKNIKRDTIIFTVKYYAEMNKNLKNNEVKQVRSSNIINYNVNEIHNFYLPLFISP